MSIQVGRKLIDEAEFEDLAGAKVILTERPDHARPAGFLSHLAAEKALKGLLAAIDVRAPKTHDLDALVRLPRREHIGDEPSRRKRARCTGPMGDTGTLPG